MLFICQRYFKDKWHALNCHTSNSFDVIQIHVIDINLQPLISMMCQLYELKVVNSAIGKVLFDPKCVSFVQ